MSQVNLNFNINTILENTTSSQKEKRSIQTKSELAEYFLDKINDDSESMSDEDKEKMYARIEAKLKSGKKLSPKEISFLKKTNPQMYMQYLRIRAMADSMASQLKNAKTKQQANDIITSSMSSVSDKDPYKEYIQAAMSEVAKEFKQSSDYLRLPNNDSDLKQKNKTAVNHTFKENEEDSQDDFDPMSWSPLQEIIDSMPTFHVSA